MTIEEKLLQKAIDQQRYRQKHYTQIKQDPIKYKKYLEKRRLQQRDYYSRLKKDVYKYKLTLQRAREYKNSKKWQERKLYLALRELCPLNKQETKICKQQLKDIKKRIQEQRDEAIQRAKQFINDMLDIDYYEFV